MFIFINKNHYDNTYGVYDTEDYSLEYIDLPTLTKIVKSGVKIDGVMKGKSNFRFKIYSEPLVVRENGVFYVHIVNTGNIYRLDINSSGSQIVVDACALRDNVEQYRRVVYKTVQQFLSARYSGIPIGMVRLVDFK